MTAPTLTMVPLHQHPPHSPPQTHRALDTLGAALLRCGYTPQVNVAAWSSTLACTRNGTGRTAVPWATARSWPCACACTRSGLDSLWWTLEYPACGPDEWNMPPSATSTPPLAVLGDARLPLHPQDLGLVEYLAGRKDGL